MSEEKIVQVVKTVNSAVTASVIVELVIQLLLKGSFNQLLILLLELQLIKNFKELDIIQPALMQIIFSKIENVIEFKFLNPNFIL